MPSVKEGSPEYVVNDDLIRRLKQRAKELKKNNQLSHAEALDLIAQKHGSKNWSDLLAKKIDPANETQITFTDIKESDVDNFLVKKNEKFLISLGMEFAEFFPTGVGLKK